MSHFDVVVLGCGPAGERAAIYAARAGRKVAVVEKAHVVGGTRINWGTIPSKTLRESALFVRSLTQQRLEGFQAQIPDRLTAADFMYRERQVVQRELELVNKSLQRYRIEVFHGRGRFVDPHRVAIVSDTGQIRMTLTGDVILVATGTSPNRPAEVPFDGECIFDSDTILSLPVMPRTMMVLGAGVIGTEYASIFAALGIEVSLLDTRDRLLPYLDHEIADRLERELRTLGIAILHGDRHRTIERLEGSDRPRVRCTTREGNTLEADVLLYSVGRDGNTADLGLEPIGIRPTERGLLEVNEHFQTSEHDHIYAVGDVIGYPALASTSMEQGRQAIRHALGLEGPAGQTEALPFAIYAIPEVSYIGETEQTLQQKGIDYITGRGQYGYNPRGQIINDTGGLLKLLFDAETRVLLGAHVVGSAASELIHIGQAYLRSGATAELMAENLYNYPTLSDMYRHAAYEALKEHADRMHQKLGGGEDLYSI